MPSKIGWLVLGHKKTDIHRDITTLRLDRCGGQLRENTWKPWWNRWMPVFAFFLHYHSSNSRASLSRFTYSLYNRRTSTILTLHFLSSATSQYMVLSITPTDVSLIENLASSNMMFLRFLPVIDCVSFSTARVQEELMKIQIMGRKLNWKGNWL